MYAGWKAAAWATAILPAFLVYRGAAFVGLICYWCWPRGRDAARANMRGVLGEVAPDVVNQIARASFQNYMRYIIDLLRIQHVQADEIRAAVDDAGSWAAAHSALSAGRGLIIATTHSGNWDLGGLAAVLSGFNLAVLAEGFDDPRLEREVLGQRERMGMRVLRMERPGPSLIRHLRDGGVLAVLCDRPLDAGGVECRFFGAQARVPGGVARLALAAGAPIMPMTYLRTRANGLGGVLVHGEPIWPEKGADREASVVALTQKVLSAHEPLIRQFPEQWYMFRRMWPEVEEAAPAQPPVRTTAESA
jgi:KDO2-lipid IV(A) lauroyltransferase